MKKLFIFFIIGISLFSQDFRNVNWGMNRQEVFEAEDLFALRYREKTVKVNFSSYKGDMLYSYTFDEYIFDLEIDTLGDFEVTYTFLDNKLIKTKYKQGLEGSYSNFNRMKRYLTWKYGAEYEVYGFRDNFVWLSDRTRVVLDLIPNKQFTVEYHTNVEELKKFIHKIESGKEFLEESGSEYENYNKISDFI